jgi:phage FluMu protein Com
MKKNSKSPATGKTRKAELGESTIDMTGIVVGRWTVVGKPMKCAMRAVSWLCRCSCGTVRYVGGEKLRQQSTLSCGCKSSLDMTGKTCGKWHYLSMVRDVDGNLAWTVEHDDQPGVLFLFGARKNLKKFGIADEPGAPSDWTKMADCGDELTIDGDRWIVGIGYKGMQMWRKKFVKDSGLTMQTDVIVPAGFDIEKLKDCIINRSLDIVGKNIGTWHVDRKVGRNNYGQAEWECRCRKCGHVKQLSTMYLNKNYFCPKCKKVDSVMVSFPVLPKRTKKRAD